jgi:hypothetical protein
LQYDGHVKSAHWHGVEPPPGRDVRAAPRPPRRGAAIVGLRRWQLHDGDREPGAVPGVHVRQRVEAQLLVLLGAVERGDVEPAVPVRGARRRRVLARHHHQRHARTRAPRRLRRQDAAGQPVQM